MRITFLTDMFIFDMIFCCSALGLVKWFYAFCIYIYFHFYYHCLFFSSYTDLWFLSISLLDYVF